MNKQWEYNEGPELDYNMNYMGSQGWEAYALVPGKPFGRVFYKREKRNEIHAKSAERTSKRMD